MNPLSCAVSKARACECKVAVCARPEHMRCCTQHEWPQPPHLHPATRSAGPAAWPPPPTHPPSGPPAPSSSCRRPQDPPGCACAGRPWPAVRRAPAQARGVHSRSALRCAVLCCCAGRVCRAHYCMTFIPGGGAAAALEPATGGSPGAWLVRVPLTGLPCVPSCAARSAMLCSVMVMI